MRRTLIFLISIFSGIGLSGQFYPGTADMIRLTSQKVYGRTDSIFVFNIDNADKYIYSLSPDKSTISFVWSRYDTASKTYVTVKSESADSSVLALPDSPELYKIKRSGSGWSDSSTCWVLINDFRLSIQNCDTVPDTGKVIRDAVIRCGIITNLDASYKPVDMVYFNPDSMKMISFTTGVSNNHITWSCSKTGTITPTFNQLARSIEHPYWEDCYYILKVTDDAGLVRKDSAFYKSIEPHAEFSYEYIKPDNMDYFPGKDSIYYDFYKNYEKKVSAPALYIFTNKSKSSTSYEWNYGDSLARFGDDSVLRHIYYLPGTYYPQLVTTRVTPGRYKACTDTFPSEHTDSLTIKVDQPQIPPEVTNVLAPNSDNWQLQRIRFINEVSIGYFEIAIYNRYGKRVYHYEGEYREWEGWDGTDRNSGTKVSTGVYYYVVKEIKPLPNYDGTDQQSIKDQMKQQPQIKSGNIYRGFIHVYNN